MAKNWYSQDELARLNSAASCPYWQRLTPLGSCVDKWWAGGPIGAVSNSVALVLAMTAVGAVAVYAADIKLLRPAVEGLRRSRQYAKAFENRRRPGRRRASWR